MNSDEKRIDSKEEAARSNERRIEQLIDVVEKHTRTERHLEQNMDITSPDDLRHTLHIQKEREEEIENLKNIIAHREHNKVNELDNLSRNYAFTNSYLENNSDKMDPESREHTEEKQENRKDQIRNITDTTVK